MASGGWNGKIPLESGLRLLNRNLAQLLNIFWQVFHAITLSVNGTGSLKQNLSGQYVAVHVESLASQPLTKGSEGYDHLREEC